MTGETTAGAHSSAAAGGAPDPVSGPVTGADGPLADPATDPVAGADAPAPVRPSSRVTERIVRAALDEDAPWGDVTSSALVPAEARADAVLVAREPGVLAGADAFAAALRLTDDRISTRFAVADGQPFDAHTVLADVTGPARSLLQAERVGLNLLQRMSGIAALTARYVAAAGGTRARIVDTRKTTPGLRPLERYAVQCGGGHNHRYSLSDAVMAKDNHLGILTAGGKDLTAQLIAAKKRLGHTTHIEVEVDRPDQIAAVLAAGVDTIMLDNFTLDGLRAGVAEIAGRALVEASGNVSLETVRSIAETGVDLISVGALTHGVRSLDIGLDLA